ncbi:MAG: O-antigen ligase family protein [Candidatus Aminicenantes bacterium]|nr:O-antigen ligase family protein [Candidatus Aminicenantes bacterium]
MKSLNLRKKWGLSPFLNFGKERSIWISLPPLFIALYLLFSMVSISLSQGFISLALICWIIMLIREKQKFIFPSFFWPLIAFTFLSLVSSFFSVNPTVSFKDDRELLLFLIIPIVYTGFFGEKVLSKTNLTLLASGYLSCFFSFYLFFFNPPLGGRISGFMGQVMTQAGLLLLLSCMALSMLLFTRDKVRYLWGVGILLSLFALILTQTRSSWIGLVIASSLILFLYKPKALILVPIILGLFYFASPQPIKNRALSSFNPKHPLNTQRIEYMRVGIKIIKEFPLFGTGPDTVDMVFKDPKYKLSEEARRNVHLHNNILQIGAERGIPALLAWLTFMIWIFISLLKLLKNKNPTLYPFTVAGLAALIGLAIAGLFEYNFADSEITALFLYIITIPFSLARIQGKEARV